jgi:hypothetical protein
MSAENSLFANIFAKTSTENHRFPQQVELRKLTENFFTRLARHQTFSWGIPSSGASSKEQTKAETERTGRCLTSKPKVESAGDGSFRLRFPVIHSRQHAAVAA